MLDSNPQLNIYGLAAAREFSVMSDFKTIRTVIHQPRLGHVSERVQTIEVMNEFESDVALAAVEAGLPDARLNPSAKACRWCKAKGTCKALANEAVDTFEAVDPDDVPTDDLAVAMSKVKLIEIWAKAIRAEVERRLLAGETVNGWKIVQGKRGYRQWTSEDEAEAVLKAMRVPHDRMYYYAVVSPTTADRLAKEGVIGPRQWHKLQALITQAEGKPSVAPESDKRTALALDEFSPVSPTDLT